ncbi:TPA: hypothetical protein ACXJUU_000959 [Serratia marcescens]
MDNKLSELSKPVAWEVKGILCHSEEEARAYVGEPDPLCSQEYVSALLAELEAKDKRIAELEQVPTIKHMRSVEEAMICATDRVSELEAKLATPVRLPSKNDSEFWFDGVFQVARFDRAVERAIRAAGFTVGEE